MKINEGSGNGALSSQVALVIGVTGHRDLVPDEVPMLRARLERFFNELAAQFPDLPLQIVGSLAQGADSLVAEVAQGLGHKVINILPMSSAAYRDDFDEAGARTLAQLIEQNETHVLPHADLSEDTERDLLYERAGVFIAAHCHLLLALWDGKYNQAVGGTAHIVDFHQRGASLLTDHEGLRSRIDVADDESDLVFQLACSRLSAGRPVSPLVPGEGYWFSRDEIKPRSDKMPERYQHVFASQAQFNRDVADLGDFDDAHTLEPEAADSACARQCAAIRAMFRASDTLARRFQQRTLLALRLTIFSALFAGFCFIGFADLTGSRIAIAGYFVFVALALGSYWVANRGGWRQRYLDYRVLAEGLRVQYYWALAGVTLPNFGRYAHDCFLRGRELELGWIRNAMRSAGLRVNLFENRSTKELDRVMQHWIGDSTNGQLAYFVNGIGGKTRAHLRSRRMVAGCFVASLVTAGVLFIGRETLPESIENLLIAFTGLLPLIAAARQNYAYRVAERELLGQYGHMQKIFTTAAHLLHQTHDTNEQRAILHDLGEAALDESGQWLLRQRERPLPGGEPMN